MAEYRLTCDKAAMNARKKKWADEHREERLAARREARKADPVKWRSKGAFYRAQRRAAELKATPPWADKSSIEAVYSEAAELRKLGIDVEVDHLFPLQGEQVCGLHVKDNLRIVLTQENRSKHNLMP